MIFIGIGSNLSSSYGNRIKNINLAISFIQNNGIKLVKKSSFYETFSQPNKNDPKFINVVISVETNLLPLDLLKIFISIEKKLGRERDKRNSPRTCDIDIIDYKKKVQYFKNEELELILPHKRMHDRNFVLFPLKEIASNWTHPETKKNIDFLINKVKFQNNQITKLSDNDINEYVK